MLASSHISMTFTTWSVFDIKKKLYSSVKLSMELLAKSGVEFTLKETLHDEKTTGWITNDHVWVLIFFYGYSGKWIVYWAQN